MITHTQLHLHQLSTQIKPKLISWVGIWLRTRILLEIVRSSCIRWFSASVCSESLQRTLVYLKIKPVLLFCKCFYHHYLTFNLVCKLILNFLVHQLIPYTYLLINNLNLKFNLDGKLTISISKQVILNNLS
jgi:hypothetical protein